MNPRFERRREHLLKDAEVKPQVYREALKQLPEFIEPYLKSLGRREQKVHLREYVVLALQLRLSMLLFSTHTGAPHVTGTS